MAKRKLGKSQKKDYMDNAKFFKYILIPCGLVIIASCIYLIWFNIQQQSTYKNIQYIKSFVTSSGKLNDYQNKIGMHDPETDIKWFKTNDEIRIEFGRIYLTWEPEDFYKEENLEQLATIGITTKIKEDDKSGSKTLHLYYHDKELERWVK